jgi:hypothetical protein
MSNMREAVAILRQSSPRGSEAFSIQHSAFSIQHSAFSIQLLDGPSALQL